MAEEAEEAVTASAGEKKVQKMLEMSLDDLVVEGKQSGGDSPNKNEKRPRRRRGRKRSRDRSHESDKRESRKRGHEDSDSQERRDSKRRHRDGSTATPPAASHQPPPGGMPPAGMQPAGMLPGGFPPHRAPLPGFFPVHPPGWPVPHLIAHPVHAPGRPMMLGRPPFDPHRPYPPPMHGAPIRSPMPPPGMMAYPPAHNVPPHHPPFYSPHPGAPYRGYAQPPAQAHPVAHHAHGHRPVAPPHQPLYSSPPAHVQRAPSLPAVQAVPQPQSYAFQQQYPAALVPAAQAPAPVVSLQPAVKGFRIRLSNVPSELTANDLAEAFVSVSSSRVESVDVLRDAAGSPTGEATVVFGNAGDAQNAMKRYDGGDLNGRRLKVVYEGEVGGHH